LLFVWTLRIVRKDILQVLDLHKHFATPQGIVRAVDGISFSLGQGETLGLVGESGSGKSTVAYTVIGKYEPTAGEIRLDGELIRECAPRRPRAIKKKIQMVFQDPGSSLNPRRTIRQSLELPLRVHGTGNIRLMEKRILELLRMVELSPDYAQKVSSTLSGGEKARAAIARALATEPRLIVLDEPTSALDVSIQAKILRLLIRLQEEMKLSYLFISHDLSLMRNMATRVAIMYLGKIVEIAPTAEFFQNPIHPYTRMLLSSAPVVSQEEEALKGRKIEPHGEIPSPVNLPSGCRFHTRCPDRDASCSTAVPEMIAVKENHFVNCHCTR
jgi:peptide/nickel transport system ATP-binding protein